MSALIVSPWPGPVPAPQDGLFVIDVSTSVERPRAREQIRSAARDALASVLGVDANEILIDSTPGQVPRITLAGAECAIGCSFTHEDGYSLAAINLNGAVGVDLMRVEEVFDWQAVARDYLGPEVCAELAATPAAEHTLAFVLAWTRHEAVLKYHGVQLAEWSDEIAALAAPTRSTLLPNNLVVSLACQSLDPTK
ncbi:4'-phosphopantetheinyl transferase family protein [Duganella violaceipulchra]|uniref:4'-phosphopantetheinyl transferase n=1 Tax=Duganella violaceipulchra TaxID=2849652 RepID=A0AA41H822_9BURK|nr:4'-phosphopantetheinyl transferase superfamily protein [Duganella violaceicalia]MBV6319834.1 4'-phosphopantetheinyl transferase superfamily protein [Duganella violaceicalia]MCP2006349.1 4'-phosphopantetheinyl transferase [Duganella violaceicalia]